MKAYRKLTALALGLAVLILLVTNLALFRSVIGEDRSYRVEISRASEQIRQQGLDKLDLSAYPGILRVTRGEDRDFLQGGEDPYVLREIQGQLYRFDYSPRETGKRGLILAVNLGLVAMGLLLLGVLGYLGRQIVAPFETMKDLPGELARGNLSRPLPGQKRKYFGNFLWGMDLLREELETRKAAELKLQKEKKSLILSLAHDIKTPLSAIKLYSQALEKQLYSDREKQIQAAERIGEKTGDIERYVNKLISASQEDFLHLEVRNGEFYLSEVEKELTDYYEEKLRLVQIPFAADFGSNCLLKGDRDRAVEVFQNILENAIKYGSGGAIAIRAQEEGNCRILTVSNENCSLPMGELPHIFDSFWRGSNGETVPGSGLGLYICRQLMNAMGGEIYAQCREGRMELSLVCQKAYYPSPGEEIHLGIKFFILYLDIVCDTQYNADIQ